MKTILALLVVAAAAWWYFVGASRLSEDQVVAFYRDYERATLERNPEALCKLLADDFSSTGTVAMGGQAGSGSTNHDQACDGFRDLFAAWEKLGNAMGGLLQLDSSYELHSISIAPDHKSAEVDISSSLDVAGNLTQIRSRSTDTLVRRHGKVLLLASVGTGSVGAGGN